MRNPQVRPEQGEWGWKMDSMRSLGRVEVAGWTRNPGRESGIKGGEKTGTPIESPEWDIRTGWSRETRMRGLGRETGTVYVKRLG